MENAQYVAQPLYLTAAMSGLARTLILRYATTIAADESRLKAENSPSTITGIIVLKGPTHHRMVTGPILNTIAQGRGIPGTTIAVMTITAR